MILPADIETQMLSVFTGSWLSYDENQGKKFSKERAQQLTRDRRSETCNALYICKVCNKPEIDNQKLKPCPCKKVLYCSKECQVEDWKGHKKMCHWHLAKKAKEKKKKIELD